MRYAHVRFNIDFEYDDEKGDTEAVVAALSAVLEAEAERLGLVFDIGCGVDEGD